MCVEYQNTLSLSLSHTLTHTHTCCTMVVSSRQSWTMLFFSTEYSETLTNGDLQTKQNTYTKRWTQTTIKKCQSTRATFLSFFHILNMTWPGLDSKPRFQDSFHYTSKNAISLLSSVILCSLSSLFDSLLIQYHQVWFQSH